VLLISRAPGVDFSLESSSVHAPTPTADINVIPPSREHSSHGSPTSPASPSQPLTPASPPSLAYFRNRSAESIVRPAQPSHTSPKSPSQTLTSTDPLSFAHSRNHPAESLIRPARTDPIMLFPPSVRGAGYNGTTNPYSPHSRNVSSDSQLANAIPMKPLSMS